MLVKPRPLKAQVLVFEQLLLFTMGVIIFIVCFAAFSIYQSHFSTISANDQLNEIKEIVASNIVKLYHKDSIESTIRLDIPERIGGKVYKIELSSSGLEVSTQGMGQIIKTSPVFNLGSEINLNGRVISTSGTVMIYKKENEIIII